MIEISDKTKCSGCTACFNVCPKDAIEMIEDEEGFLYPKVNKKKCIKCGLCSKICPNINKIYREKKPTCYIAYNKNENIRNHSTSGGIFSAISKKIVEYGGVVFGASYDKEFNVEHTYVESEKDLEKFRGSKYVQSKIGNSYRKVKEFLNDDRYVLFSGTPCQIYGLKMYLQKEYEKLYCVDLVCHGVPSPKVIRKYKIYQKKKFKAKIKYMSYREKTYGASSSTMTLKFENGKEYVKGYESDFVLGCFIKGLISRPSCYNCNFKTISRISDFTLGDVWNAEKLKSKYSSEIGNTAVFVHSQKGKKLLLELDDVFLSKENLDKIIELNAGAAPSMLTESAYLPKEREEFFIDLNKRDMEDMIKKYYPKTLKGEIKRNLKKIFYKVGLLEKVKKIK